MRKYARLRLTAQCVSLNTVPKPSRPDAAPPNSVVPYSVSGGGIIDMSYTFTAQQTLDAVMLLLRTGPGCDPAIEAGVLRWTSQLSV